jgi:hypothetical protein
VDRTDRAELGSGSELPESYGETRVVALPVDPFLLHAYWEVTPRDLAKARAAVKRREAAVPAVLRFYDVTGVPQDRDEAFHRFDVEVDLGARNWYVHLWSGGRSYLLDLGLRDVNGSFVALARSGVVHLPRAEPLPGPPSPGPPPEQEVAPPLGEPEPADVPEMPAAARPPETLQVQAPAEPSTPAPRVIAPPVRRRPVVDMRPQVWKILKEIYRPPAGRPTASAIPPKPKEVDWTAVCERSFTAGESSGLLAVSGRERDGGKN